MELSPTQRRIAYMHGYSAGSPAFHVYDCVDLEGDVSAEDLQGYFGGLSRRHPQLNTVFSNRDGRLEAWSFPNLKPEIVFWDLSSVEPRAYATQLRKRSLQVILRQFPLKSGPLWRVGLIVLGPRRLRLILAAHHIIMDGHSFQLVRADLEAWFSGGRADLEAPEPGKFRSYEDFSRMSSVWADSEDYHEGIARRSAEIDDFLSDIPDLAQSGVLPEIEFGAGKLFFSLEKGIFSRVTSFCRAKKVIPLAYLLAVFSLVEASLTGAKKLVICVPMTERMPSDKMTVGFFVNLVPVCIEVDFQLDFSSHLAKVKEALLAAHCYKKLHFDRLINACGGKAAKYVGKSPVIVNYFSKGKLSIPGTRSEQVDLDSRHSLSRLSAVFQESEGSLEVMLEYNRSLFSGSQADGVAAALRSLVELMLDEKGGLSAYGDFSIWKERVKVVQAPDGRGFVFPHRTNGIPPAYKTLGDDLPAPAARSTIRDLGRDH